MFTLDADSKGHVPFRKVVPNLFTTVSLCSGLASINYSLKAASLQASLDFKASVLSKEAAAALAAVQDPVIGGMWKTAMLAIGVSAIFDMLDGRAARILRATSRFGAIYDSLSDFLAFGVAPAILIHQWMLKDHRALGMAAVTAFVLCAALRLARFTAMPRQPKSKSVLSKFFIGLPTPAAAGAMLVPPMLDVAKYVDFLSRKVPVSESTRAALQEVEPGLIPQLVIFNSFLIAALMISRVPMFSFKKVRVRRGFVPALMVLLGMFVLAMFRDAWLTVSVAVWCYLALIPFSVLSHRRVIRDLRRAESAAPPAAPTEPTNDAHALPAGPP